MRSRSSILFLASCYEKGAHCAEKLKSPFLLLIRAFWGAQLFLIGQGKLTHIADVSQFFTTLGIPYPTHTAYFIGSVEAIGGLCLLFGFLSRLVSIPVIILLLVAYGTAHVESLPTIWADAGTFAAQAPFPYLFTALVVFIFGPGSLSLDGLLKRWFYKEWGPEAKVTL